MPESGSKAALYRHKANGLRALAEIMERSTSRLELLAEAVRWERLAAAVEDAEKRDKLMPDILAPDRSDKPTKQEPSK